MNARHGVKGMRQMPDSRVDRLPHLVEAGAGMSSRHYDSLLDCRRQAGIGVGQLGGQRHDFHPSVIQGDYVGYCRFRNRLLRPAVFRTDAGTFQMKPQKFGLHPGFRPICANSQDLA